MLLKSYDDRIKIKKYTGNLLNFGPTTSFYLQYRIYVINYIASAHWQRAAIREYNQNPQPYYKKDRENLLKQNKSFSKVIHRSNLKAETSFAFLSITLPAASINALENCR